MAWFLYDNGLHHERVNEITSRITHILFLHVILRRSQMVLTSSRQQMVHNVPYVVLCAEVTCEGYFVIQ